MWALSKPVEPIAVKCSRGNSLEDKVQFSLRGKEFVTCWVPPPLCLLEGISVHLLRVISRSHILRGCWISPASLGFPRTASSQRHSPSAVPDQGQATRSGERWPPVHGSWPCALCCPGLSGRKSSPAGSSGEEPGSLQTQVRLTVARNSANGP